MAKLLTTELFDSFLVEEVTIDTFNTFTIDGRIHKEFYKDSEESQAPLSNEFSNWAKIRPIALSLIKGKQTPLGFKFILHLSDSDKLPRSGVPRNRHQVLPGRGFDNHRSQLPDLYFG